MLVRAIAMTESSAKYHAHQPFAHESGRNGQPWFSTGKATFAPQAVLAARQLESS